MDRRQLIAGLASASTLGLAACAKTPPVEVPLDGPPTSANDIVQIATSIEQFSTFMILVEAAELESAMKAEGPFTVFMPSEAAFAKIEPTVLTELLLPQNKAKLVALVSYHILPRRISGAELRSRAGGLITVQGTTVRVDGIVDPMTVNGAAITQLDINARNGVIHRIDTLLVPRKDPLPAGLVPNASSGKPPVSSENIGA